MVCQESHYFANKRSCKPLVTGQGMNSGAISSVRSLVVSSGRIAGSQWLYPVLPIKHGINIVNYSELLLLCLSTGVKNLPIISLVCSCATSRMCCGCWDVQASEMVWTLCKYLKLVSRTIFYHFLGCLKFYSWENLRTKWRHVQQAMFDYRGVI